MRTLVCRRYCCAGPALDEIVQLCTDHNAEQIALRYELMSYGFLRTLFMPKVDW